MYLGRQIVRARAGDAVNLPKLLLFAGVIPLHWLTFAYMGWLAAVPTVTIVHNLQYHALIWFYNRNRYSRAEPQDALTDGFRARYRKQPAQLRPDRAGLQRGLSRARFPFRTKCRDLAFGFFCGFGLTHYYLDSRIWRVRHDPSLRQALQLA